MRRGERSEGFVFGVGDDRTVLAFARVAVHDETARGDVDDPVFDDSGAGVEFGFGAEIECQCGIGNFDHQAEIIGLGVIPEIARGLGEYDEVRFGLVGGIVFRSDIAGRFGVDKLFPEGLYHTRCCVLRRQSWRRQVFDSRCSQECEHGTQECVRHIVFSSVTEIGAPNASS